jgi:hypothetical protein
MDLKNQKKKSILEIFQKEVINMGGGGSGASRQKSKSETTPEQKMMWHYYMTDVVPMARGKDTWLTKMMEQTTRDEADRQGRMAQETISKMGARSGMSPTQIASMMRSSNEQQLQNTLKTIAGSRMNAAKQAMQMIAGLPMMGEKSESKTKGQKSYVWGLYSG